MTSPTLLGKSSRLLPLLAAFLILGVIYDVVTPIFEKPDEAQHFFVIKHIAQHGRLPRLGVDPDTAISRQETMQAPLYYMLAALAVAPIDLSDAEARLWPNPKRNFGDATLPEKKNVWIHTPAEAFPWRGATLAVHVARWVALLMSAGTVACTYALARLVAPDDERLALASAATVAFLPMFAFISSSASNDSTIAFLSSLSLTLLVWIADRGLSVRRGAVLGVSLGLLALSKLIGTVLLLASPVLLVWIAWKRRELARWPATAAAALGTALAIAGWWYVRNWMVYGEPLALQPVLDELGSKMEWPSGFGWHDFVGQGRLLVFSAWGLFGQANILIRPVWIYGLLNGLVLLAGVGWVVRAAPTTNRWVILHSEILFAWLAIVVVMVIRWWLAAGGFGRLLFPALAAMSVLVTIGWRNLAGVISTRLQFRRPPFEWLLPTVLLVVAIAAPVVYIPPEYAPPPLVETLPSSARRVNIDYADTIRLEGYTFESDENRIVLTFYWRALQETSLDYQAVIRMRAPDGSWWLDYVNYTGQGTSLTSLWRAGELREDRYEFHLWRLSPVQGGMDLLVGFFEPKAWETVAVEARGLEVVEGYLVVVEAGVQI